MGQGETVRVAWLLPDGRGGATLADGRTARIHGAIPGDEVRLSVVRARGRTVDAEVEVLVTASPDRRAPPCPHSAACGGCDLDALAPEGRARALTQAVAHVFRALAPPEVRFVPSPDPAGYRARIKLAVEGGRLGYRAARSHELVPIDVCGLARPEVAGRHAALARWLAEDPARGRGLASVELRSDGTRVVAAFASDVAREVDVEALSALPDVALDGRRLAGEVAVALAAGDLTLRAGPAAFYQVNFGINAALVDIVREAVLASGAERVLDLYAGIGNLGLPIAAAGVPVVAVEAPGPAVDDLRHNVRHHALPVEVHGQRVERLDASRIPFDAVVLDPPRVGAPGVLPRLLRHRPRVVVYVACDPRSAARDLAPALAEGYRLAGLHALDMFPDTHHVEAVAVLERR
ncbi:MAG: RsmD family RNA methyltransferase [Myxococcota bacterium]